MEAYGLIGLYASLLSVATVLDLGLAPTVNREVARAVAQRRPKDGGEVVRTLEQVYWAMAMIIAALAWTLPPLLSTRWLIAEQMPRSELTTALQLLGIVIAARWPLALYQNALIGAQKLKITSTVGILVVTLSNGGGVLIVALVDPSVQSFFLWQVLCVALHVQLLRVFAWRCCGPRREMQGGLAALRRIWRFSAGMTGVAITGVLLLHIDKLILSGMLPLQEFGYYSLGVLLAGGLYVLLTPTFNVLFPRFSALVVSGDDLELERAYRHGTRVLVCVLFPLVAGCALFAEELLWIWTRDLQVASVVAPVFALLLAGTALNGVMHFPYALQLAAGSSRLPLQINAVLLAVYVPTLWLLATRFGIEGGATSWLLLNLLYLLGGSRWTHRRLLPGVWRSWLLFDVGLPMLTAALLFMFGYGLIDMLANDFSFRLFCGVLWGLVVSLAMYGWFAPDALRTVAQWGRGDQAVIVLQKGGMDEC